MGGFQRGDWPGKGSLRNDGLLSSEGGKTLRRGADVASERLLGGDRDYRICQRFKTLGQSPSTTQLRKRSWSEVGNVRASRQASCDVSSNPKIGPGPRWTRPGRRAS